MKRVSQKAFSTLPVILFLGGLLVEIGIAVAFLLTLFANTNLATRLSDEAIVVAEAGVEDGIQRTIHNKDCGASVACPASYDLLVGSRTASVTICKDLPQCDGVGKTRIESTGVAGLQRRRVRAVLTVDATTGAVSIDSIQEVAL